MDYISKRVALLLRAYRADRFHIGDVLAMGVGAGFTAEETAPR